MEDPETLKNDRPAISSAGRVEKARALRASMRNISYAYTAVAFGSVIYLFAAREPSITAVNAAFASIVILLGGLPLFLYLYRAEVRHIPLLALNGLFYVVAFGLPVLSREVEWQYISSVSMYKALEYTVVGLVALIGGYYATHWAARFWQPYLHLPKRVEMRHLRLIAYTFYGVHLAYAFIPAVQNLPTLNQFALASVWIGIGLIYYLLMNGQLHWSEKVLFFGVIIPVGAAATLHRAVLSSRIAGGIHHDHPLECLGENSCRIHHPGDRRRHCDLPYKKRIPSAHMVLRKKDFTYVDKIEIMFDLLAKKYQSTSTSAAVEESQQQLSTRLSHIYVFSQVVNMTPYQVQFWEGGSYVYFLYSYIPRFLWPDKPESTIGNEFGHRYSFLSADDNETSWNLPWLIEFYANYGSIGVIIGMALIGVLFRMLVGLFSHPEITPLEYVFGLTVLFPLYNAESNLALMWSGAITTFIAFYVALRILLAHRN
ncbi:MAG: hypothetical protein IPP94_02410 [Ignavibacteria bacterium]|nr:hypothetical protein [Ignavibacteria bacterium]